MGQRVALTPRFPCVLGDTAPMEPTSVTIGEIETALDVISFCDFRNPNGNELSAYQVHS